ncbi:MAG TPA: EAL domain-containing protein [Noviherbaspirillum sp.]
MLSRGARTSDGQTVLLRIVPEQYCAEHVDMLRNDFHISATLGHSAIRPLALDNCEGRPALVLEDFGAPLPLHPEVPLPTGKFLALAAAITAVVADIHRCGIVHKALDPSAIFIDPASGEVRIAGFGLAEPVPCHPQHVGAGAAIEGPLAFQSPEQTGRMNRTPDRRSDLYALGVIFYQMLTARLPFDATDALGWAYCHAARVPVAPADLLTSVPPVLSAMVMKLLAKDPEDRYQGAEGLLNDLQACLQQWKDTGDIAAFPLAQKDVPTHFQLPQKLYGREAEIAALREAFERMTATGQSELVLVSGYSGIGKSSLVNELCKPIIRQRAFFGSGKFDQYKRDIPYATIVQAFAELVLELLAESEERIAMWRQRLTDALGVNAQLIIEVIPQVELIIGPQPPVPTLPPTEARNRFSMVFRHFIGVFARKEHPLVLFLDDLQWVDAASLALLQTLLSDTGNRYFMPVCAYRDNEVHAAHPFQLCLESMRAAGTPISHIVLGPLADNALASLVRDTVHRRHDDVVPLVRLIREKTDGNPFFALQFLVALHDEHLIEFDPALAGWRWDIARIEARGFTDNVAEFMVGKLKRLPLETQEALQRLACLGTVARTSVLALALERSEQELHMLLSDAVRAGLVFRFGDRYKFLHDRVQEAAYSLIALEQRPCVHAQIGRRCIAHMSSLELEENLFDVVNQLNQGLPLIDDAGERALLRRLNHLAGQKAKASIAYGAARNYFERTVALLPPDAWQGSYDDTFNAYIELAECEYLTGNAMRAEELFSLILRNAASRLDRARVYSQRIGLCQTSGRFEEAVDAGLQGLALFGIVFPESDADIATRAIHERERIAVNLAGRVAPDLYDLPVATDRDAIASIDLLTDLFPCAFVSRNGLYQLLIYKSVNLSLQYGNTGKSCFAYSGYALLLASAHGDPAAGQAFSELALRLNERFNDVRLSGPLLFLHCNYLNFWHRPFSENVPVMEGAFRACLEVGDLVWSGYLSFRTPWQMIERGDALDDVQKALVRYAAFALQHHSDVAHRTIRLEQQFIACMKGSTVGPVGFSDGDFDEFACLKEFENAHFRSGIAFYHVMKLMAAFIYRRYGDALDSARQAAALRDAMMSMPTDADWAFYHALTLAALYTQVTTEQREEFVILLKDLLARHETWARNCPENFLNRHALIAAEIARIEGRDLDAMRHYEQAIRLAAEHGFVHNEALANELAAHFYRTRGSGRSADAYLRHAHACYARWGASGKVRQLESLYPQLQGREHVVSEDTSPAGTLQLDALAVIKASQALSEEIAFDRLLAKLLQVVIEQAGAQKGYVILQHGRSLAIEAEAVLGADGSVEARRLNSLRLNASTLLPVAVVNYVWRTRQKVLLENAADSRFSTDPYIAQHQPKSVLCQPIFKQAELVGLLYLENNLLAGAFPAGAMGVLELIASQAAISIENARLYADLKEENSERRRIERELQLSEAHYRRLFETAKDGILLLHSTSGIVTDVNSHLLAMIGYRQEDIVGKLLWKSAPFRDSPVYRRLFEELQLKESVRRESLPVHAKDGRVLDVELVSSAYRLDETRIIQCNIRDVTDRRRAEQRLAVQFAATRVLAGAASFQDAARNLLQVICNEFGWDVGELWEADSEADRLRLVMSWESADISAGDFVEAGRQKILSQRDGLPGKVLRIRKPVWVPDVVAAPDFLRRDAAEKLGLRGSFSFPVITGGKTSYVMGFFSRGVRAPDEEMIDTMQVIGSQIGQFIQRKRAEQALIESEQRFRSLTDLSSDWYWEQDEHFRYTVMSEGLLQAGGIAPESMIGRTRNELEIDAATLDAQMWEAHLQVLKDHKPFRNLEYKVKGADGRWHWYSISGEPMFDEAGVFRGYRGTGKEISERKQAEALTLGQARVLEMIAAGAQMDEVLTGVVEVIESQSDGMLCSVLLLDDDGVHIRTGAAPSLPIAYTGALEGLKIGPGQGCCGTAMYRRERVIVADIAHDPLWFGYRELALDHGLRACWSTPIVSQEGTVLGAFAMYYREVREPGEAELRLADFAVRIAGIAIERKKAEQRISYMAHHDALTGLPNRVLLQDRLMQAVAQAQRIGKTVAVMFIDLDYFKHINDSLGHPVGDKLLQAVASRLAVALRKGDTLARLGGDEFVLILPAVDDDHAAASVAQKILDELKASFRIDGHELHVGGSIGISLYPDDGEDAGALMRAADTAMYHAKAKGRANYQFFTQSLNAVAQHRLAIASSLRQALARTEFSLHYQPQIDMERGRIVSAEALLRWKHPERGFISPVDFIPIAEETGLILPIGEWVLRDACEQLRRWRDEGFTALTVAVNLSPRQLMQPGFAELVESVLAETGVPASALGIEITESILMHPTEENLAPLNRLSQMGVQLSVDDFGTGYSSLSYLKRFPIHALKIDKSFIRGIGQAQNDTAITTAIIAMANSLNLKVIAEGVETPEQEAFLRAHQCALAQGYYYSMPVPAIVFAELLRQQAVLSAA